MLDATQETKPAPIGEGYGREWYLQPSKTQADDDLIQALLPNRRKARQDFKTGAGLLPYPTYVAMLPDGTMQRLSFYSRAGKPMDFAAGYNVSMIIGRAKPVLGWVEYNGTRIEDPFFLRETVVQISKKESPAKRLAAIVQALREGEIEAAIRMAEAA